MKKTLLLLDLLMLGLLLVACVPWKKTPPPAALPTAKAAQPTPLSTAQDASNAAMKRADEANAELEKQRSVRDAQIKARVVAVRAANQQNTATPAKSFVDAELGLVETTLADVVIDQSEFDEALKRKALFDAGQDAEARKQYSAVTLTVQKSAGSLALALAQREQALSARDAARQAEAEKTKLFLKQLEDNRAANQKVLDDLVAQHKQQLEAEQKAFMKRVGNVLIGVGVIFILIAGFVMYAGSQMGNLFKSVIKGLVFLFIAFSCFAAAWTINQPWFKTVMVITLIVGVLCVVAYLWAVWKENKERKSLDVDADIAERTLTKVAETIHERLPADSPIYQKFSDVMNDDEKALILELRALAKKRKMAAP